MLYTKENLPLKEIADLPNAPRPRGNQGRKNVPKYKAVTCAFDIETTAIKKIKQSIMYIWQLQIGHDITIIGRTWDEFLTVSSRIREALGEYRLVTYVHNLSYEFCFLCGIHSFKPDDVFCTEPRNILHADFPPYEFRCSYRLTNMSLDQFTREMKVAHRKLSGAKFDYSKKRYPWTSLSKEELDYATYDVIGLVEAVDQLMLNEGDTLYSIPMTNTGYVRRDVKKSMKTYNWTTMKRMIPDYRLHKYLRKAFRGGNTHADRHFVGQILHNVQSWDMASAYPSAMINKEFPMGKWFICRPDQLTGEFMKDLIHRRHKAVILDVAFEDIHLKDPRWPVPYLSYDKCDNVILYDDDDIRKINKDGSQGRKLEIAMDNGRIMGAEQLTCVINDIDLEIISEEYTWKRMTIRFMAHSTYAPLPNQFREVVKEYYIRKTTLKNVAGSEYKYDASKRKINAIFGSTVMDVCRIQYFFDDSPECMAAHDGVPYRTGFIEDKNSGIPVEEQYEHYLEDRYNEAIRWPYQSYAWGVWITSWCRYRLEQGIKCVYDKGQQEYEQTGRIKTHFVYCDTDSIKFVGSADISMLNEPYMAESVKNGAFAMDPKGKTHYLGVYEYEGTYPEFITWGAKKYVYRTKDGSEILDGIDLDPDGRIENGGAKMRCTVMGAGDTYHITIAGVGKKAGGRELEKKGGIAALKPDEFGRPHFIFKEAGGVDAIYNDDPKVKEIGIQGRTLKITPNVYLEPHAYTLSVTDDFSWIVGHPDYWYKLVDGVPDPVI